MALFWTQTVFLQNFALVTHIVGGGTLHRNSAHKLRTGKFLLGKKLDESLKCWETVGTKISPRHSSAQKTEENCDSCTRKKIFSQNLHTLQLVTETLVMIKKNKLISQNHNDGGKLQDGFLPTEKSRGAKVWLCLTTPASWPNPSDLCCRQPTMGCGPQCQPYPPLLSPRLCFLEYAHFYSKHTST